MIYRSGSDRFKLSIGEKIHPSQWNTKRQRAKANKSHPELVELNYLLDNIDSAVRKAFYRNGDHRLDRSDGHHPDNLLKRWYFHIDLIADLGTELTRLYNYLIELIRDQVYEGYRNEEGALVIGYDTFRRPMYTYKEQETLYPGMKEFLKSRTTRKVNYYKEKLYGDELNSLIALYSSIDFKPQ